jgi:hypothetical protein
VERQEGKPALRLNIGVGIVLPIERVRDVVECNDLVNLRHEQVSRPHERVATLDSARTDEPSGLGTTADLMRGLLQVPKEQADEVHRGH